MSRSTTLPTSSRLLRAPDITAQSMTRSAECTTSAFATVSEKATTGAFEANLPHPTIEIAREARMRYSNRKDGAARTLALLLALVVALGALLPNAWAEGERPAISTAVREQSWSVAGLKGAADIVVDHWGIAHIFASNTRDAFFLQ